MENNEKALSGDWYMNLCLGLAQRAKGHTAPNPMVGAVLVHNDRVIGEGWHHYYGADHAEVNCLKNIAEANKHLIPESTMYVNLEPCAHQGITPPCADRLVHEKVKKVIIANTDPFEKVSGKGVAILNQGGIDVETGLLRKEGLWLNRRFFCFHERKRPYIILKWAQTQDGFIAPADRRRFQITGSESLQLVHKWRTEEAAIMVGATTALNDNPQLTARLYKGKQPLRIVLDRDLHLPLSHHIFDNTAATWIVNQQREILNGNVHSVQLPFDETLLTSLLHRLYDARILSLIVEGGAHLLSSFITKGLWDEARIFTSNVSLQHGLPSPKLIDETEVSTSAVGSDRLQVFVNKNSNYPYVPGMEL
jgi:diaminohydroxyphosphoribosylaminopyrimidine deaminase / 5-amino-6-(5-phosphoribosylamino)uracil reductase